MTPMTRRRALAGALSFSAIRPARATSRPPVDLALVLALDVSRSVIERRFNLQRTAYVEAFLDPDIIGRIRGGPIGRIAVTAVQWSDSEFRKQVVPWTTVSDDASGAAFGALMGAMPRAFEGKTCVGGGMFTGIELLLAAPYEATRNAIDISGDGTQNDTGFAGGQSLEASDVRDKAAALGIRINGLPILLPPTDPYTEGGAVVSFYKTKVITPDGFMIVVPDGNDKSGFKNALKRKLVLEIS